MFLHRYHLRFSLLCLSIWVVTFPNNNTLENIRIDNETSVIYREMALRGGSDRKVGSSMERYNPLGSLIMLKSSMSRTLLSDSLYLAFCSGFSYVKPHVPELLLRRKQLIFQSNPYIRRLLPCR